MAQVEGLLVCSIFADGPYWQGALEILGPPADCSFFRSLNYRREYVDQSFVSQIDEKTNVAIEALIGMRFSSPTAPDQSIFIPLRFASANVTSDEATIDICLQLKNYAPLEGLPGQDAEFSSFNVESDHLGSRASPMLVWAASTTEEVPLKHWESQSARIIDRRIWEVFAESPKLTPEVKERFAGKVVLYVEELRDQASSKKLESSDLLTTDNNRQMYGYNFEVGNAVDVQIGMRRIAARGGTTFDGAPDYRFATSPDLIDVDTPTIPFTGNYRSSTISLRPKRIVKGRADLQWMPVIAGDPDRSSSDGIQLRVPFGTRRHKPISLILSALFFLALGVISIVLAAMFTHWPSGARISLTALGPTLTGVAVALYTRILDNLDRQR